LAGVTAEDLSATRRSLAINDDAIVGLFCGSLYPDKHLDFLVSAALRIRTVLPNFHLLVIGGGADSGKVEMAAEREGWIHYLGPRFGREKATYFRLASIFLNPGLVGLAILDAFVAGLPVFTTNVPVHSPEVQYLENDVNGFMVEADLRKYADIVLSTISSPERLGRMRAGALKSARRYSIERMVENFHSGVVKCLGSMN
jgi:glycosyltransferase involved in cell wall biosynthesis